MEPYANHFVLIVVKNYKPIFQSNTNVILINLMRKRLGLYSKEYGENISTNVVADTIKVNQTPSKSVVHK